tara:strand:- start:11587 stop:13683 length:2097 start_codon:yes stop_codon:yes gene_type:complete
MSLRPSFGPLLATLFAVFSLLLIASFSFSACGSSDGQARSDASPNVISDGSVTDAEAAGFRVQFIDPSSGPFTGGTTVTIRGNGFTEESVVFIGGRMVEPIEQEFIDSRRFVVRTPPGEPGLADVEVRKSGETATLSETFSYEAIVVDPPVGSVTGGTRVRIEGFGTDFGVGTSVRFDGLEVTGLDVVGDNVLTAITPPGISGGADVEVTTLTSVYEAKRAFTYLATADPFAGGMGGGPIDGDINVVVLDANTDNGVDGAFVSIGDPQNSPLQGYADDLGQISFSGADLVGPIRTTAAAEGYETASFVDYDARDITIKLRRPPEPAPPGTLPPGPQSAFILGHVVFGDSTGLGSPVWNLVPEPRNANEVKRIYVTTTAPTIFSSTFGGDVIDYAGFDPNKTAWEFKIRSRASATAVVAMAGLYNTETENFDPFAMGVARGILAGPAENVVGVDVVVNIPLDSALLVNLDKPPALGTPGWAGPIEYTIRPFIDLGGEGSITMNAHGLPPQQPPALRPGTFLFEEGDQSILLPAMAPLTGNLADASYSFIVGAYSESGNSPFSVRIERGVTNVHVPVTIGDFLGTPRPIDPAPNSLASSLELELLNEAPADGAPTFHMHTFSDDEGTQLLRMFARGTTLRAPIPNLLGKGVPVFPNDRDVSWTFYSIQIPDLSFDDFTYRHLGANYWSAYAADSYFVRFP